MLVNALKVLLLLNEEAVPPLSSQNKAVTDPQR